MKRHVVLKYSKTSGNDSRTSTTDNTCCTRMTTTHIMVYNVILSNPPDHNITDNRRKEGRKAAWWCRVSSYGKRTYTHHSTWMDACRHMGNVHIHTTAHGWTVERDRLCLSRRLHTGTEYINTALTLDHQNANKTTRQQDIIETRRQRRVYVYVYTSRQQDGRTINDHQWRGAILPFVSFSSSMYPCRSDPH